MSSIPELAALSAMYSIAGLLTKLIISFGTAFENGKNLVPSPATGITAFLILEKLFSFNV